MCLRACVFSPGLGRASGPGRGTVLVGVGGSCLVWGGVEDGTVGLNAFLLSIHSQLSLAGSGLSDACAGGRRLMTTPPFCCGGVGLCWAPSDCSGSGWLLGGVPGSGWSDPRGRRRMVSVSPSEQGRGRGLPTGWPKLQAWVSVCKWHPAPTARCSLGGLLGRCLQDTICAKRTHYLLTWGSRVPPGLGAARGQQSGGSLTPHPHLASITHSINNQCLFHALLY